MRCFNTVIICYYCFQITLLPMTNPKQYMSGENMMHSNVSDHPRKSQLNVSLMSSPRLDVLTKTGGKLRHSSYSATKRRKARRDGNVIIGALFPVHHRPPIQTAYSRVCGLIREYYGIQRIETFLRTIDQINSNASILPHITLGWDIRDSCWYSAIALEQSIDFVQDAIASQTANADEAIVNDIDGETSVNEMANTPQLGKNAKQFANKSRCVEQRNKPIVGLVGPGSSEASIQVQNLLQIFNIPQIGYSATSMDLSDKNTYRYFLRVVPPDYYQVQVLVDILLAFNWTYISTVHSDGNYGIRGMEMFTDLASSYNICVATTDTVASSDRDHEFDQVVTRLQLTQQASVVVCFCEGITVKKLLSAIKRKDVYGKFLIIGSDGWGNRLDVVMGQEDVAVGGISVKLYSPPIPHFSHYYASLKPNESQNWNPWFNEFWQEKFQCYLPGEDRDMRFWNRCSGDETLKDSDQDSKLGFVVNAVTTMALALHDMSEDLCPEYRGLCPKMNPINGTLFLNYLLNVSFESYSGHYVHFDKNGDPPGRYEILNYQPIQQIGNKTIYDYVTIGQWMSGNIQLNEQSIFWPNRGKNVLGQFRSVCSEPCRSGFVKRGVGSARIQCCWVCTACKDNEIVVDEARCSACNQGWWPNEQKSGCDEITVEYINWRNTWSIMATAIACTGLLLTVWVTVIFIRSQNTAVVKASTRELSYILLLGISLAFSSNFVIFSKPFKVGCYLLRIIPGLAFSMMYGALVTRTNRIARILEGRKRITTKKPRFMSAAAQVFFTAVIIAVECIILIVMFFVEPANITMDYSVSKKVRLICKSSVLGVVGPMAFDFFLIMMCTLYAVKTRNLPENFNEAKFIGFTMYTTCVIWLAFLPIYFGANYKEITMSVSISCSAGIALLLLFLPKVYIIIWAPEKNTRSAFTTSRDVRCHVGPRKVQSSDSVDNSDTQCNFVCKFKRQNVGRSWRQKSLGENTLHFLQRRSSSSSQRIAASPPPSTSTTVPAYINHGVICSKPQLDLLPRSSASVLPCANILRKFLKNSNSQGKGNYSFKQPCNNDASTSKYQQNQKHMFAECGRDSKSSLDENEITPDFIPSIQHMDSITRQPPNSHECVRNNCYEYDGDEFDCKDSTLKSVMLVDRACQTDEDLLSDSLLCQKKLLFCFPSQRTTENRLSSRDVHFSAISPERSVLEEANVKSDDDNEAVFVKESIFDKSTNDISPTQKYEDLQILRDRDLAIIGSVCEKNNDDNLENEGEACLC